MDIFAIAPDFEAHRYIGPDLSLATTKRTQWEQQSWTPYDPLELDAKGQLVSEERARIEALTVIIDTSREFPISVMGTHDLVSDLVPDAIVVVSAEMKDAIETLDPAAFEFVRLRGVVNLCGSARAHVPTEVYLARALVIHDALDKDASGLSTKVSKLPGAFPRRFKGSNRVFEASRLPAVHYFRDETTGRGICTSAFRKPVEKIGCDGWLFFDCTLSGTTK